MEFKNVNGEDFKKHLMLSTKNLHKIPESDEVEEDDGHVHGDGCSHGHEHPSDEENEEDRVDLQSRGTKGPSDPEFSEADKKYLQNLVDAVSSGRK